MEIDVLLPGGKWRGGTKKGFCRLEIRDIEDNNLAVLEEILPGSIPNIWSNALHFSWVLKRTGDITPPQEKAMNLLELYLKGIFVQVLTLEKITLDENSLVSYLLKIHNPLGNDIWNPENLLVLRHNNQIVAINYPECIFAPTAQNSAWPDDSSKNPLESEMIDDINTKFAELKEDGKEAFESWIQEILNKGIENPPWHKALLGKDRRIKAKFSDEIQSKLKTTNDLTESYSIKAVNGKFSKNLINITIRTYIPLGDGKIPDLNKIFNELKLDHGEIKHEDNVIIGKDECEQAGIVYIEKTDKTYAWQRTKNKLRGIIDVKYEDDGFTLLFGKSIKNFKAKILNDDNFFVSEIFALKREIADSQEYSNIEYLIPNLPIREYEYCDLMQKSIITDVAATEELKGQITYVMDILGRQKGERKNISLNRKKEISPMLIIWPNFKEDNWKLYYIFNSIAGKEKKDAKLSLYFDISPIGDSKTFFERIEDPSREVIQKDKPPAAFSLSYKNAPCGIYFIDRLINLKTPNEPISAFEKIPQSLYTEKCQIGIDFGTSSTCISYNEEKVEPQILTLNFRTAKVLCEKDKYSSLNFIPEIPQKTIPSVLRVTTSLFNEEKYIEQAYSAYNFSPMLFSKDKLEEMPGQEIYRRLKWGEEKYRRSFMFILFKHIFSEIRFKGKKEVDFRVSFPFAFDSYQLQKFINLCIRLINDLTKFTGFKSNPIGVLSESEAGSYSADRQKNIIVLDMGGETTDIYISLDNGAILADSIRLAGGHILDSIIKKVRFLKDYEEKRKKSDDFLNDSIIFKLRKADVKHDEKSQEGVVQLDDMMDSENKVIALNNTSDGKEIIFEYIRRLLFAKSSQNLKSELSVKPVKTKGDYQVWLIGRGWNLRIGEDILRLLQKYIDVDKYYKPRFDPKEALAIGILKAINPKTYKITETFNDNDANELLKKKITYTCAKCRFKAPKDDSMIDLEWTDLIPFKCKSEIRLEERTTIELRIIDLFPTTIINKMLNHLKDGMEDVNEVCYGKFSLSKTSGGDNAITASPFATMIENAFKKYLET